MKINLKSIASAGFLALSLYSGTSSAHGGWRGDYDNDDDWRGVPDPVGREYYPPPPVIVQPPVVVEQPVVVERPVVVEQPVVVEEPYYASPPPPQPYYYGGGRSMVGGVVGSAIGAAAGYQLGYGDPVAMGFGAMAGALLGQQLSQ